MNTEQSMHVNYTPSTAAIARTADMHPGNKDVPFFVTLLHDFGGQLEDMEEFAGRLEEFRHLTANLEGSQYYHVDANADGQQFSVYDKAKNILEVRDFSYQYLMPESVWHVSVDKVVRSVLVKGVEHKKVWGLHRDDAFQKVWEVIYNEHPREPLHMRQGNIPYDTFQFLTEVYKQLTANTKLSNEKRNAFMSALHAWEVSPLYPVRTFTEEEMAQLWNQCAALQHLHQANHAQNVMELFQALDFLTLPDAKHTLSEWAEAFGRYPDPTKWPTVLRNACQRNNRHVGRARAT